MYVIKTHDFLLLSLFAVGRPQKYSKYWGISGQTHSVYGTPRLTRGFRLYKKAATVYIARDLKSKGNKSLFSNASYIPHAVRDQVLAAKFLVKCGLI